MCKGRSSICLRIDSEMLGSGEEDACWRRIYFYLRVFAHYPKHRMDGRYHDHAYCAPVMVD